MSVALAAGGMPIDPALVPKNKRLSIAGGGQIIFNVAALRDYLLKALGKPLLDKARPFDDSFKGKKGIIAFSVNWNDATGHIALFNGATYREPSHDNYASLVVPATPTTREVATCHGEFWEIRS